MLSELNKLSFYNGGMSGTLLDFILILTAYCLLPSRLSNSLLLHFYFFVSELMHGADQLLHLY